MKTRFTLNYVLNNSGCYMDSNEELERLTMLFNNRQYVSLKTILECEVIPFKDRAWFLCNSAELTKKEKVSFAVGCAEIVCHLYNNKYPNDDRVNKAIQAAKDYLNINNNAAAAAADAAYAAAYAAAADAAYAYAAVYADAAYAAAAAADAAAYAYDAAAAYAYAAAYAAAAYADGDSLNKALESFMINFIK